MPKTQIFNLRQPARVMEDFQKAEESSSPRNGTFKINAPFERALDTILKAKPEPKKPKMMELVNEDICAGLASGQSSKKCR